MHSLAVHRHIYTHTHRHAQALSYTLTLSHPHTHTYSHTHTDIYTCASSSVGQNGQCNGAIYDTMDGAQGGMVAGAAAAARKWRKLRSIICVGFGIPKDETVTGT